MLERLFDQAFGETANPLRQLGSLGYYLFWIIIVSGVYVYAFFETSIGGAYRSVEAITREQWWLGGVMRSLHRYASDAFVVVLLLHILRELAYGRFRGFRWLIWLSGVPLIWLTLASGVVGYWLVWDRLGQYVAIASMEWLSALPGFDAGMMRNVISDEALSDRLFSLLIFLHIGVPLLLLAGMWVHVQRITQPRIQPHPAAGRAMLAMLLTLAVAQPAVSQAAADLSTEPAALGLDWYYLFMLPAVEHSSAGFVWLVAAALTLALAALPWTFGTRRPLPAVVYPQQCNGCKRCLADCPYSAISMEPHPAGKGVAGLAVVNADLCASCGLCAGACPSSTPFRSSVQLTTGIDLPGFPVNNMRNRLDDALATMSGDIRVAVFSCDHGVQMPQPVAPDTAAISLPCIGALPPSFVEYALRSGADGVLIAGCGEGDCEFRLGTSIVRQRLIGEREPHLRTHAARRMRALWLHRDQANELPRHLAAFREELIRELPASRSDRHA
jgi:ferredoxin/coenzyme F420-reducing hydrogenase delta subunit